MKEVKYVKNVLFALIIMISICTLNACNQSNEQKRDKAVIKIEKCISNHKYDKANEIVETIPDEFETEKKEYRHKIMTSRIKYDFKEVFDHMYKVRALIKNAEILYQYVGGEFLLSEVLAYWMKRHLGDWPKARTDNYRKYTFATRTMQWANKQLVAWAVIDDTGHECSHWMFAGSDETSGGRWWIPETDSDYAIYRASIMCG